MFPATLLLKGKANLNGTEAEQRLASLLLEDNVQVLSSFELNQIASLTYGELVCDQIFEMLEQVLAHPLDHSTLCLQKSLVVVKHIVIYGSEKCINSAWALGRYVNALREFNTILAAQQRQGPDAWWQRVKGGGVDKGFPVREAANELNDLLSSKDHIQMMRHTRADPNSLVPVGDDKVAFVSDEVRHYMLKKRLEEQQLMHTKSNLAKERGGFGGGYQAKDGKAVVGAAHSLEEMMARAKRLEKQKFSDDGPIHSSQQQDYLSSEMPASTPAAPEVDLLDFTASETSAPATVDFLGTAGGSDLMGGGTMSGSSAEATADLLSLMTVTPVAPPLVDLTASQAPPMHDAFQPVSLESSTNASNSAKKSIMGSNVDRFAALDALSPGNAKPPGSMLSGLEAQNRILESFSLNQAVQTATKSSNGSSNLGMISGGVNVTKSQPSMAAGWPPATRAPAPNDFVQPDYSSISMGVAYGDPSIAEDDDSGFVMGGVAGSGLEPTAAAPAAPPPPPPP